MQTPVKRTSDRALFGKDDLAITDEKVLGKIESHWRNFLARWLSVGVLAAVAVVSLLVLFLERDDPPSWAQSAIFSILTASIAYLFSEQRNKGPTPDAD